MADSTRIRKKPTTARAPRRVQPVERKSRAASVQMEGSADAAPVDSWQPRIYYVHPPLLDGIDGLRVIAAHAAELGFNHILLAPPFLPGRSGNVFLSASHERLHPALGGGELEPGLAQLSEIARSNGLDLLVDLVLDRVAIDGELLQEHREWYRSAEVECCDPRQPPEDHGAAILHENAAALDTISRYWSNLTDRMIKSGVAGFRCCSPNRIPAAQWQQIIRLARIERPSVRFLAWTAGHGQMEIEALRGCGFDAVSSSFAWWDFGASWLVEEHERLRRVAPVVAFPEAPFGRRVAAAIPDPECAERLARRAVATAAALFDGLVVSMGFEFGARDPMDAAGGAPGDFEWDREHAYFTLEEDIRQANWTLSQQEQGGTQRELRQLSSADSAICAIFKCGRTADETALTGELVLANRNLKEPASLDPAEILSRGDALAGFEDLSGQSRFLPGRAFTLGPGEICRLEGRSAAEIRIGSELSAEAAAERPRIVIEALSPVIDGGRFPIKRTVGEAVTVEADIFGDGHDVIGAVLLWRPADEQTWREVAMEQVINDRWRASFPLTRVGPYRFAIEAWRNAFATYREELRKKHEAGKALPVDVREGRQMITEAASRASGETADRLSHVVERLGAADADEVRIRILLSDEASEAMAAADGRPFASRSYQELGVEADRLAARFSAWYELFPRSQTDDPARHGTLRDVIARLPHIRDMGFDVLYFPPIHPIGTSNRKGRNNSLTPAADDPGSPYAIGSDEGGHDAIHPELGTFEDFRTLNQAAHEHGLEIALDFAIQCSPDHPWLEEHPDWFAWRADGSLRYAENPPKKYEDIVNVDFYAKGAVPSLWIALRDIVAFWVEEGVRIFRVDNPHTKPLPFWEWMIADIRSTHPDVIFLSEAFTRPKMMYRLAKLGFTQSYTYFTWRDHKPELTEYLEELTSPPVVDFFRPNFFVNTPDINPHFLQTSGRPGFLIRAALAATLASSWGMYNGFELCEAAALPGKEEYLNSEKYEIKPRNWRASGNIIAEIARLNHIRRTNPALQDNRGLTFYNIFNDSILYFGKSTPSRDNVVLVAVSLDPFSAQEASFEAPLWEFGLHDGASLDVEDLFHGENFLWQGKLQHVRLDPSLPFAVWRVRPARGA